MRVLSCKKSLGLISQPFRRLSKFSLITPVLSNFAREHKEKSKRLQDVRLSHNAATPMFNPVFVEEKHHCLICSLCRLVNRQRNTAISHKVEQEISNARTHTGACTHTLEMGFKMLIMMFLDHRTLLKS